MTFPQNFQMPTNHIKHVCICPDDALPVIIKINPCPGQSCPYAREPSYSYSSASLFSSEISSSDSVVSLEITSNPASSKTDSATSTSDGKKSVGSITNYDLEIVDCQGFEPGGKCINDVECATTSSLLEVSKTKMSKSVQVICVHRETDEEKIFRESRMNVRDSQNIEVDEDDRAFIIDELEQLLQSIQDKIAENEASNMLEQEAKERGTDVGMDQRNMIIVELRSSQTLIFEAGSSGSLKAVRRTNESKDQNLEQTIDPYQNSQVQPVLDKISAENIILEQKQSLDEQKQELAEEEMTKNAGN